MDEWLRNGTVRKRRTTELESYSNLAEENPKKKITRVSDAKLSVPRSTFCELGLEALSIFCRSRLKRIK